MALPNLPNRFLLAFTSLLFSLTISQLALAEMLSPARQIELTVVPGKDLALLQGANFQEFSVMAVSEGRLQAIPFQFDDRNEVGLLYVPGGALKVDGSENIFEAQDELAFMLKDAGKKASTEDLAAVSGTAIYELNIEAGSAKRYAYIFKGNPERSDTHYTHFDKETGLIKTNAYTLQVNPDNLLDWSDYTYHSFTENRSLLDTMKLRVKAKLGFVRATINNKLIPNEIVAVKNGPVKSIIEMDATISILGIKLLDAGANVQVTENTTQFPVFITIPKAASVLSDLALEISLDFDQLDGSKIRTALGPKDPVIAGGGGADPKTLAMDLNNNWIVGSSGKNWDITAFFVTDEHIRLGLSTLYKDHALGAKPDKPERVKNSHPQVGYIVTDLPIGGSAMIGINLYYSSNFWQGNNPEKAADEINNPAVVSVLKL